MSEQQSELLPCPFCGAGDTQIEGKGMWTGQGYSEPISVSVRHWCTEVPGQPSRMIERIGRDRASAIEAWNRRAALSKPSTEQGWTREINQELERQYLKGFQAGKAFDREQCALVCENYRATWSVGGDEFAAAIRSRKDAP